MLTFPDLFIYRRFSKVAVRCNVGDVEPDPAKIPFGMPVRIITRTVRTDKEGRDVIAFFFTPEKQQ